MTVHARGRPRPGRVPAGRSGGNYPGSCARIHAGLILRTLTKPELSRFSLAVRDTFRLHYADTCSEAALQELEASSLLGRPVEFWTVM